MPDYSPATAEIGLTSSPARELQELLLATEDVENFLQHLIELAVSTIGGNLSAGVTVARDGHPATVASSDDRAAQYDAPTRWS
jgi:hypothetical protein